MKWQPRDVIALVVILGLMILKILGYDDIISWSLFGIVVAYYGVDFTIRKVRREDK